MIKYLLSFLIISLLCSGYSFAMADNVPPYVIWDTISYPEDAHIWTDSVIGFDLADDDSGVATTSIKATLDDISQPVTIESIDDRRYHIICRITIPNIPMYDREMLIRIEASDCAGNQMPVFQRRVFVSSRTLSLEDVIAYPNPWLPDSGTNVICFSPLPQDVEIQVFDLSGERIRDVCLSLLEGKWEWDLRDNEGNYAAPGLYLYLVTDRARNTTSTGKILIVR